jgi:hypothetical protein
MLRKVWNLILRRRARRALQFHLGGVGNVDQGTQTLLALKYRELHRRGLPLPSFDEASFRCFSQTGEDGILLLIFSLIGTTNRRVVELCAGNAVQSNSANWIVNHGWTGLLIDGDPSNVRIAREFYDQCRDTPIWQPTIVERWITKENVNATIQEHGFSGDLDLLSLDLDGNDYWIWEALDVVRPRVMIVEYESGFGPQRRIVQKYAPDFVWQRNHLGLPSHGASLAAYVDLGRRKGFRLVAVNRLCFNAVFLREDVGQDTYPTLPPNAGFGHPSAEYRMAAFERELRCRPLGDMWLEL